MPIIVTGIMLYIFCIVTELNPFKFSPEEAGFRETYCVQLTTCTSLPWTNILGASAIHCVDVVQPYGGLILYLLCFICFVMSNNCNNIL